MPLTYSADQRALAEKPQPRQFPVDLLHSTLLGSSPFLHIKFPSTLSPVWKFERLMGPDLRDTRSSGGVEGSYINKGQAQGKSVMVELHEGSLRAED